MSDKAARDAQRNELEALKSIFYQDELRDLRKKDYNIWQPLKIALTLTPQQGSITERNAKVDLIVTCSEQYPYEDVPKLEVQNVKGISQDKAKRLLDILEAKARERRGEEMIYELAAFVQEFLYDNSVPERGSFYDEMLLGKRQKELEQAQKQNQEKEILAKEVKERQELHKQANKRYQHERRVSERSSSSGGARTSYNDSSAESSGGIAENPCEHPPKTIKFAHFDCTRGQCVEHCSDNCVSFISMDTTGGQLYLLTEWTINYEHSEESGVLKQIGCIEVELRNLLKLKHTNLVHYISMTHTIIQEEMISVNLLSEFVLGSSCFALFLSKNISLSVEVEMLKWISESVLSALDFLHGNNIVHKNLCAKCVYICKRGDIKLANYSIYQRLSDLVSNDTNLSNYSKKIDVYDFGVFVLSLAKGKQVDTEDTLVPYDVEIDLKDFIERCLSKDENRYTTSQLLSHSFLNVKRSPAKKAPLRAEYVDDDRGDHDDIPFVARTNHDGKSRVDTEFETLDYIGKGAYGQVHKVRNILDDRVYALKSIQLTSKNRQTNRKIIREVKLLSGLNHENVVRYYNSWIESATVSHRDTDEEDEDEDESGYSEVDAGRAKRKTPIDNFMERLVPNARSLAWSISYGGKSGTQQVVEDDESSSSGDDVWSDSESDLDIEFDNGDGAEKSAKSVEADECDALVGDKASPRQIQIMYIQMEFCDKSTLRSAIDDDLYKDQERLWKLFREIIEGMTHIHQQGMIHRDLKPVNIFLDANDHVKIGDFGLATSNLLTKNEACYERVDKPGASGDPSLTGHIGTAMYVAPELTSTAKASYNQKVDIYSLGIIFFEMSYKPCPTQSERFHVLAKLRSEKIAFPEDFAENATSVQKVIIKWLLDHKPDNRPTSQELLDSEHMPPPVLEEKELRDLLKHTLKNTDLKAYKYLVESCLNQPVSVVQDISYDTVGVPHYAMKHLQVFNHVKGLVAKIFELHGGQELNTPLLMPRNKCYDGVESCVRLMTHSGSVVTVPHDLRIPFARYVAWNGIASLRRYSIAKVYREKRAFGFVPRELYECAFDIVTPTPGNLMADAEVIYLMDELAASVPGLRDRTRLIRLNHMSLLKAILLYCGIKGRHSEFYGILAEAKEGKVTKMQVRTHLNSSSVSNHHIATLFKLLGLEAPIGQIHNQLQTIIKRRNTEPGMLIREALKDLQTIIEHATNLGVTSTIVINLGLIYKVPQYSGMICQLAYPSHKKHKQGMEVLAVGGRYDETINAYRSLQQLDHSNKECSQSAVGVSISLDTLVASFLHHQQQDGGECSEYDVGHLDVLVGNVQALGAVQQKSPALKIMGDLRAAGVKALVVLGASQKEITDQADELNVPYVIVCKAGEAKIQHCKNLQRWDPYSLPALVENLHRNGRIARNPSEIYPDSNAPSLSRSESVHRAVHQQSVEASVNIVYLINGERDKMAPSSKKRYEQLIKSKMDHVFNKLNGDVTLFAMNVGGAMVSAMATHFNFTSEEDFQKSLGKLKEKYPKHKTYLDEIRRKVYAHKTNLNPAVILFSLEDHIYHVIL